jgi:GNAT superfamily N-acetyltransferase
MRSLFAPACLPRLWQVAALELGQGGPSAAELSWVLACQNAADLADRPGEPATSAAELRSLLAPPYRGRRLLFAATDEAGGVVGWARLGLYEAFHHDLAHAAITVHPVMRRRGVGSMLLDALAQASRSHNRSRLVLDAPRTSASEAFAARHGLYVTSRDLRSRLDLDRLDLTHRLNAVTHNTELPHQRYRRHRSRHARPSVPEHRYDYDYDPGYSPLAALAVLCWNGPCPDEFVDQYVSTLDFLHAEPASPSATPFTHDEIRHREQAAGYAGLREYTACLIDRETGRIAALSSAHTADGLRGEQNETVVAPDYRGMGLAVQVKVQLIRELLTAEPNLAMLDTYNAVDNHRMLAVNRRLGFRPLDAHAAWSLTL